MRLIRFLFIFSMIALGACTKKSVLHEGRWSGDGERPSPPAVGLVASSEQRAGTEKIQFSRQVVDGFLIESAYLKTIAKENAIVFQRYAVAESLPAKVLAEAKVLDSIKNQSWALFLANNPSYQNWKLEEPPHILISTLGKFKPVLAAKLSNKSGEIFELRFTENGRLSQQTRVGSNLADLLDVVALAFPKGPKKSELSKVLLSRLNVPEGLSNNEVEIKTESPYKINSFLSLEIQPMDERFDQIQAYYFANQIISWFEKKLLLKTSFKTSILTHVGYPEKTNTAFYYNGQVRLGSGDDVAFSKIPWDPSIVMHEVCHSVIDDVARLPFQGEGGSINEGFADTFTTFFLENPRLGENAFKLAPFKRAVDTPVPMSQKNGGLYHDSAIVSSFFWNLKSTIGPEKSLALAFKTLEHLAPNTNFQDFILNLKEQSVQVLSETELVKANELMKKWDFM